MKVVLRALLGTREVNAAEGGVEVAQRRNITVRPAAGGRVELAERARVPVPA
jgi:hypothetical protein